MANRADFQMLNDSLANLGNSFVINRQMAQQSKERELARVEAEKDRELRERMLNEQIAGRKDAAEITAQSRKDALDAKAKGGTVTTGLQITKPDGDSGYMEWRGAQEGLDALVQNFEGRGGKVKLIDPSNAQKPVLGHVIIKTPVGEQVLYPRSPEEFQSAIELQKKLGVPAGSKMPTEFERDPNKEYITAGGALIPKVKPDPTQLETVTEVIKGTEGKPEVKEVPEVKHWLRPDEPGTPGSPAIPATPERRITRRVPVGTGGSGRSSNEVIRIAPNGKKAVFDASTKKFLRYAD